MVLEGQKNLLFLVGQMAQTTLEVQMVQTVLMDPYFQLSTLVTSSKEYHDP